MAKSCTHQSLNLVGKGIDAIHSGGISGFNQQVSGLQGRKGNISRRHPDRNNDDLGLNANQNSEDLEDSVNGNDTGDDGEIDSDKDNSDCDIPGEEAHFQLIAEEKSGGRKLQEEESEGESEKDNVEVEDIQDN
ncbi:hypothetical protein V8E54_002881 [Elaphomyces granulatus]